MCERVTCTSCGKPTFAGCGRHIDAVLSDVPPASRCRCRCRGASQGSAASSRSKAGERWLASKLLSSAWSHP
jgi:hypothetical protein